MDKKAKAGVAAAMVAAGVAVNQAFSPSELTHDMKEPVQTQFEEPVQAEMDTDVLAAYTEERRMGRADRVRTAFLRLPVAVKAAALLPLWAIGALPAALVTALSPFWHALLGLALHAAALAAVFALAYKLLFPHKKLRDLFRKKNLKWLFLAAVLLTAADVLLGEVWTGWPVLRVALMLAAGYVVLCLLWKRLCGKLRGPEPEKVRTELRMEY